MEGQDGLRAAYQNVKSACRKHWASRYAADGIPDLAVLSLRFLESEGRLIDLVSRVNGKEYVSFGTFLQKTPFP